MIVMKITNIDGDCQFEGYEKWITIDDVSWDISREPKESGKGATIDLNFGIAEAGAVNVTKQMDVSSIYLMQLATGGGVQGEICEIKFIESGAGGAKAKYTPYLEIELVRPVIKKWGINASGDERPTETVEIMYNAIKMKYTWYAPDHKATPHGPKGWDLIKGKPID